MTYKFSGFVDGRCVGRDDLIVEVKFDSVVETSDRVLVPVVVEDAPYIVPLSRCDFGSVQHISDGATAALATPVDNGRQVFPFHKLENNRW